jgi:hypothetical protein
MSHYELMETIGGLAKTSATFLCQFIQEVTTHGLHIQREYAILFSTDFP